MLMMTVIISCSAWVVANTVSSTEARVNRALMGESFVFVDFSYINKLASLEATLVRNYD